MVRTPQDADGRVGAEGRADRRDPRSIKDRGPPADQAISSRGSTARGPAVSELVGEIALVLLFIVSQSTWVVLIFPAWVLIVSVYILVTHLAQPGAARLETAEGCPLEL